MKKIISFLAVCAATASANAATGYMNPNYSYKSYMNHNNDKSGCYVAGHFDLSFLNFKNKYSSDYPNTNEEFNNDNYSFEPVLGADVAIGYRFSENWRGELELGYLGRFVDTGDRFEYKLSAPYLMANGYFDFIGGLYVGLGAGAAMPTMETYLASLDTATNQTKNAAGFIGAISLGYSYNLDTDIILDLRYRLSGLTGIKQTRNFVAADTNTYWLTVDTGFVLDNSISLGIRYEF